uniref:Protein-lysine N-methyltransferase SMYD4 n=1 Tax=Clastoptera arizonana TaxID=38151 RepID=A0A1B6BYA9_9HEMI
MIVPWQKLMDLLTLKGNDNGNVKNVKESPNDIVQFKVCYNFNKEYLIEWMNECLQEATNQLKSGYESCAFREQGNLFYKRGKDKESLELYNKSVIAAPYESEEMALALGNRSAVLKRLHFIEEALNDINLAFTSGYPKDKQQKLLLRKAELLIYSKRSKEADETLHQLESLDLEKNKDEFERICSSRAELVNEFEALQVQNHDLERVSFGVNKDFNSASNKIEIKNSLEKGRHVISNSDIVKGELLFVEKPFALIVLPDQINKHCHHCCKIFISPYPCSDCKEALYCSNDCRLESWRCYHKWECGGLSLCYKIGIAHLGFRVALMAHSTLDKKKYAKVHNLLTHSKDMQPEDLYQYTLTAVLLILYLENRTNFFSTPGNEDVHSMGGRILRHIAQLICNGHAITKLDCIYDSIESDKVIEEWEQRIATAIYPSASMMNHSCDNNILNNFKNDVLIVRASRNIKKGEEIFNCYGPHYKHMGIERRQEILKSQYFFTCKCNACTNHTSDRFKLYSALKCIHCEGPILQDTVNCSECKKRQPIVELMDMAVEAHSIAAKGNQFSSNGNFVKAIECFKKSLEIGNECLYMANFDLVNYKDELAKNYAALGDYSRSASLLEICVEEVKKRFGNDSPELTQEYFKLINILISQLSVLDAKDAEYEKVYRRTQKLFKDIQCIVDSNQSTLSSSQTILLDMISSMFNPSTSDRTVPVKI